ncbi:conserved hypothetical protein [Ixodes scapularis]|uniref:Ig-like domain-containing protein n=1 Tax=Ixodes scapularis TaxID=6945 RepID=B7Q9N0_IXOSC|nr:conserved hypothetical protein [Ixodes scapularis]|eukprot:XP_002406158.1 conserved hypothetical protein [Ixodes scapularis]
MTLRFRSIHLEGCEEWTLDVRYTQKRDAGVYECQVFTEPKKSLNISLAVVRDSLPTCGITWPREEGDIRVATERGPSTTVSRLQVPEATTGGSSNYSCIQWYADSANVTVHVLNCTVCETRDSREGSVRVRGQQLSVLKA